MLANMIKYLTYITIVIAHLSMHIVWRSITLKQSASKYNEAANVEIRLPIS